MKTRKLFTFLIVVTLLLGGFVAKPAPAKAINKFWMELSSPRPGANSAYKFHFSIEKRVKVHDWITLVLPPGSKYGQTSVPDRRPPGTDPCLPCNIPIITNQPDGSIKFKFYIPIELDPTKEGYRDIRITLPSSFESSDIKGENLITHRFYNPPNPGLYTYQIATQSEPTLVTSKPVSIEDYSISTPIIQIEPNQPKEKAGYSIDFDLNQFCDMTARQDFINIQFPEEVIFSKITSNIHRGWITINESNLLEWPTIKDNLLSIPIPYNLKSGQHISIKIDSRVGIVNPEMGGAYELKIWLSSQLDGTRSFPYFIATQAGPVLLKIEPATPGKKSEFSILHHQERLELNPLDKIFVRFPDSILLPPTILPSEVLINNQPAFQVKVEGQVVEITLKKRVKGWMPLEIKLTKYSEIWIPREKATIQLELKLKEDAEFIPTNPVEIDRR
jgi:hypothetical protein